MEKRLTVRWATTAGHSIQNLLRKAPRWRSNSGSLSGPVVGSGLRQSYETHGRHSQTFVRRSFHRHATARRTQEIRYGKWEDQTVSYVKQHYSEDYLRWLAEPAWNPPTGGETAVEIASRSVIREIQEKYADGNVLIVSHKATNPDHPV